MRASGEPLGGFNTSVMALQSPAATHSSCQCIKYVIANASCRIRYALGWWTVSWLDGRLVGWLVGLLVGLNYTYRLGRIIPAVMEPCCSLVSPFSRCRLSLSRRQQGTDSWVFRLCLSFLLAVVLLFSSAQRVKIFLTD